MSLPNHANAAGLPSTNPGSTSMSGSFEANAVEPSQTWFGFVKDPVDAALLVAACIAGQLQSFNQAPAGTLYIRSGTVLVFQDSQAQMIRWRDGRRWSPSRPQGQWLLYREVESNTLPNRTAHIKEQSTRFVNMSLRGNCRFIPNGLCKRTIGVTGGDGHKYRIVSYFHPADAEPYYEDSRSSVAAEATTTFQIPSKLPEFQQYIKSIDTELQVTSRQRKPTQNSSSSANRTNRHTDSSDDVDTPPQKYYQPSPQRITTHAHHQSQYQTPYARPHPIQPRYNLQEASPRTPAQQPIPIIPAPFKATDDRAYFQNENKYHPMFQVSDTALPRRTCQCGGLGVRKWHNYLQYDQGWTERPVWLAPLWSRRRE